MEITLARFFQLLSDDTRLRLLVLLDQEAELCVCELVHALGLSQPKVSRHLAMLRAAGLLDDRRQGLWVYYRLHPRLPVWARDIITQVAAVARQESSFSRNRQALADMPARPRRVLIFPVRSPRS